MATILTTTFGLFAVCAIANIACALIGIDGVSTAVIATGAGAGFLQIVLTA